MEPSSAQDDNSDGPDYLAFISYRHADNTQEDQQWATWLHQQLEVYDIPADLIGTTNLRGETIPERIYPVFRDEVSLPADADLSSAITHALDRSRFLIVLCSPRAVQSYYVNEEILHFKRSGKQGKIIAALILGEPNASIDDAKLEVPEDARTLECFPKALHYHLKADGELDTTKPTEPVAANFRLPDGSKGITNPDVYKQQLLTQGRNKADAERLADSYEEQLNTAKLKIIAGILGVRLEQLTQRDKIHQLNKARTAARRFRRIAGLMTVLTIAAVIAGGLAYQQWQRAEEEKIRAEMLLSQIRSNLDFMNFELPDVMRQYVPQDKRVPLMQRIDTIVEALQQHGTQTVEDKRQIAVALIQKADLILTNRQLDSAEALPLYQKAQGIIEVLVKQDPMNTGFQHGLSILYGKLGNSQLRLGETEAALAQYQSSMAIAQALVKQNPTNTEYLRTLSISYDYLGKIQLRLGNAKAAQGQYQLSLGIRKSLVKQDPTNTEYQRDLSVLYDNLGDIQLRLGETEAAQMQYQSSLMIRQALVKQDPMNTVFQRDLWISYSMLGDIQLRLGNIKVAQTQYKSGLGINKALVKQDPTSTLLQHDLSVSYNMLGDIHLRLGETEAAQTQYRSCLVIRLALVKQDPTSTEYQRALWVSYGRLGDIQRRLGDTKAAQMQYQLSLAIVQTLVEKDPTNTEFHRDLWVSFYKLATVYEDSKNYTLAHTNMKLAYEQIDRMRESGMLAADDVKYIEELKAEMLRLKFSR